jgi:GNAT superfamily N-acetyltransferase
MEVWFQGPILYCGEFGHVYATSDRLEGIVPGEYSTMNMRRLMQAGSMKMVFRMGPRLLMRAPRMRRVFAPLETDRQEHMSGRRYVYLMIVGVDPVHQGRGHGARLLRALIEDSDRRGVPHFHAIYGEFNGVFEVATLEMIEGDLPQRAQHLVRDWAEQYKSEPERMWKTQDYKKLPGLE